MENYTMKKSIICTFAILFLSTFTVAQFNIKLPSIKKPEVPKATETSAKSQNRQIVIDDGFTFFDAEPLQEYSAAARRQVGIGWHLRSYLRMFGTVPNRSGFNLVVSKNDKELTKIRCEGTAYRKAEDPVPENRRVPEDDYLLTNFQGCEDKRKIIKETGKLDVKVFYFDGDTDAEKLLRTYKIDVREATRVRGLATAPVEDVPHYYVQRHAETAASILFLRPKGYPNYYRIRGESDYVSEVEIYFNISKKRQVDRLKDGNLRCSVDGNPLKFIGQSPYSDGVDVWSPRWETAIYTDRIAPQYKTANEYMDEVSFNQYRIRLPLYLKGDSGANRLGLKDYKGKWQCDFKINGETIRTFRWTIGRDGNPVPHAEQSSGNINLNYNAFLIETEVPNGGSEYDHRLLPLPNDGFFYGIPWQSAEGKTMAGKIPTKGTPFHTPSNRVK
jgi:hypothetical protein